MSYKSIIVVASGADEDAGVLAAAAKLTKQCGASLCVVPAFPDPAADLVYYGAVLKRGVAAETAEQIRISERDALSRLEALAKQTAKDAGLPDITVAARELHPAVALAPAAVLGDLVVFGAAAARDAFLLAGLFAETLLNARSPILLVRHGAWSAEAVAVAWDGSAQAGRAVRAALPLLQMARKTIIVTNADDVESMAKAAEPERLQAYLTLHGVADITTRAVRGANVAQSLLQTAQAEGCDVLVAGAYGRPRLFELALGGTTRALVNAAQGPHVLFAH